MFINNYPPLHISDDTKFFRTYLPYEKNFILRLVDFKIFQGLSPDLRFSTNTANVGMTTLSFHASYPWNRNFWMPCSSSEMIGKLFIFTLGDSAWEIRYIAGPYDV